VHVVPSDFTCVVRAKVATIQTQVQRHASTSQKCSIKVQQRKDTRTRIRMCT
jgi:hypothetical protein